nr:hypothetical protein [Mycoplasmopsis bovis]
MMEAFHLVRQLLECISKYDADILEFRPHLVNTIKWKPSPRLEAKNTFNISKNPEVVAYSYPFLFNKIFKTKLLTSLPKFKFRELNDTKFQVYLNYLLLIQCKYIHLYKWCYCPWKHSIRYVIGT